MEGHPDFSSLDRARLYPGGLPPPHGSGPGPGMLSSPYGESSSGLASSLARQSLSELARAGTPASLDPLSAHLQSRYLPPSLPLPGSSKYSQHNLPSIINIQIHHDCHIINLMTHHRVRHDSQPTKDVFYQNVSFVLIRKESENYTSVMQKCTM